MGIRDVPDFRQHTLLILIVVMIITSEHIAGNDLPETGGKARNLIVLQQAGFDVPPFVVIPYTSFSDNNSMEAVINEIVDLFQQGTLLAVRSSANIEDSEQYSFAGQYKTVLNVPITQLEEAIAEVRASATSPEVMAYISDKDLPEIKMSVIIQQMVNAQCSGVAFGINPMTGDKEEKIINVVAGLGEELVSGQRTADSYVVRKGKVAQSSLQGEALLTEEQLSVITAMLDKVENVFGTSQDVEFAYEAGVLKLLQSRPVTTQKEQQKIVYDNSNIIESYPGMTLPLTFSFIEKMYAAVYRQLSAVLGIPSTTIKRNAGSYDHMLGLLNGRVYYNLNSWYKVLSLLPGYNLNSEFMENMMGVKNKPDIIVSQPPKAGLKDYLEVANAVGHIIYNALTVKQQKKRFVKDFHDIYDVYKMKDYGNKSLKEVYNDYIAFERLMSSRWKAPLVNDFFAMIYFGILQKMCAKYFPDQPALHNKLVSSTNDIVTTQPLRLLPELLKILTNNKRVKEILAQKKAYEAWQELQETQYNKERQAIQDYIDKWGERCVGELKLETVTYKQQPEMLLSVLQEYIRKGITPHLHKGNADADTLKLRVQSGFFKQRIFRHVLSKTRYLVSNRENLRYYRTLGFGMVRTMMLEMGRKMADQGSIENERDIFYLRLQHLEQSIQNGEKTDLKQIVSSAMENYKTFNGLELPERVVTHGRQEVIVTTSPELTTESRNELKGIPCSPGVVKATICKVTTAQDTMPDQQVMATYATDPGYVVMFPAATGILTERGSVLSHAAIVSREMNIPCIVGVDRLMQELNDGDEIIMDGSTGIVKILNRNSA